MLSRSKVEELSAQKEAQELPKWLPTQSILSDNWLGQVKADGALALTRGPIDLLLPRWTVHELAEFLAENYLSANELKALVRKLR